MARHDAPDATIRVVTLNLWRLNGDWPARRRVLIDGLREAAPDLVAFQEVMLADGYDQAADLLGDGYHLVHQRARRADGSGIAIGGRWPVVRHDEIDLHLTPRTAGNECGALMAEVRAPAPFGPIVFVNHFPSWQPGFETEREGQAVAAARAIEAFTAGGPAHVILAGDMDADPRAASIRFWTGRQSIAGMSVCYRDAWESANPGHEGAQAATFTPDNPLVFDPDWPFRRIDYLMVRCGDGLGPTLGIRRCRRIFEAPVDGVWASDHFGVVADLGLPVPRTS